MDELSVSEVDFEVEREAIASVRFAVFVTEQGVPAALEMDEKDATARHALARINGVPVGTGRLLPDGRIGRMAVLAEHRGKGLGSEILRLLISRARQSGFSQVWLSAQLRAAPFYEHYGFEKEGTVYSEAGLQHVRMVLRGDGL